MAATKKKVQRTAAKRAVKLDYAALEALLDAGRPSDALEKLSAARAKDAAAWFLTGEAQRLSLIHI